MELRVPRKHMGKGICFLNDCSYSCLSSHWSLRLAKVKNMLWMQLGIHKIGIIQTSIRVIHTNPRWWNLINFQASNVRGCGAPEKGAFKGLKNQPLHLFQNNRILVNFVDYLESVDAIINDSFPLVGLDGNTDAMRFLAICCYHLWWQNVLWGRLDEYQSCCRTQMFRHQHGAMSRFIHTNLATDFQFNAWARNFWCVKFSGIWIFTNTTHIIAISFKIIDPQTASYKFLIVVALITSIKTFLQQARFAHESLI